MADLFIPTRIRVGFQTRQDTFTGKLAYVIYYDEKNKLRKERSWESWRDNSIEALEFDNTPMNGFIFNKGIQRSREWFGSGRSVFRVFAPHDFEFEINADNLLNLLMHSDVSKREILEQCVFAWHGTELILLPTNSVEYQESVKYTEKQSMKVSAKELVKGIQYHRKKSNDIVTYIGYFDWWKMAYSNNKQYNYHDEEDWYTHKNTGKKHIFWNGTEFEPLGATVLSHAVSTDVVNNYAELVENFFSTVNSQPITSLRIELGTSAGSETSHWRRYPAMYKLSEDGKTLTEIDTSDYYSYQSEKTFRSSRFTEYNLECTFDPSFAKRFVRYQRPHSSYYHNTRYDTSRDASHYMHTQLEAAALAAGVDYDNITLEQFTELMTTLGYGKPKFVLQNGKEAEYRNRYY